jgi:hypothetical protein
VRWILSPPIAINVLRSENENDISGFSKLASI